MQTHESAASGTALDLDRRNSDFWDELCGSAFAASRGLVGRDRDTLERFDHAYFAFYPYLINYVDRFQLDGRRVLEIGLGYGTLGEAIAARGASYYGLDIAPGPVSMMRHRLRMLGQEADDRVVVGSAAAIPFADETFDYVYSIGCLHHTGALAKSIEEVRRVLVRGGSAVVMLYHANSARQIVKVRLPRLLARIRGRSGPSSADVAAMYDINAAGASAPYTEFVSRSDVRRLFAGFSSLQVDTRNFDDIIRRRPLIPRARVLGTPLERWLGLDLYIVARK